MTKKHKWFSVRTILSVLTAVLVGYVVYQNWPDIVDTFHHLGEANMWVLLLLAPEQLFMYFACGQIFFSYLKFCLSSTFIRTIYLVFIPNEYFSTILAFLFNYPLLFSFCFYIFPFAVITTVFAWSTMSICFK